VDPDDVAMNNALHHPGLTLEAVGDIILLRLRDVLGL